MFERYTERARRVIFFARYEASQFGSTSIEAEHLLLGLLREDRHFTQRFASAKEIENDVKAGLVVREKVSTSIDLPMSPECQHILRYSAEEAERLNQRHIGTEHLFLGILREESCAAAQVLSRRGMKLDELREVLARTPAELPELPTPATAEMRPLLSFMLHHPKLPETGVVREAETAKAIATAVWRGLYGPAAIGAGDELKADLKFDVWLATGPTAAEGTLFAYILKADGRILSVGRGPAS